MGVELRAQRICTMAEAPHDGIMANDSARRVIHGPQNGELLAAAQVDDGDQLLHFLSPDEPAVDAQGLVELGPHVQPEHGRLGMTQVQATPVG